MAEGVVGGDVFQIGPRLAAKGAAAGGQDDPADRGRRAAGFIPAVFSLFPALLEPRRRAERWERRAEGSQQRPGDEEGDPRRCDRVRDRPVAVLAPAAAERCGCEQRHPENAADQRRPALGRLHDPAAEGRPDREDRRRERGDEEAARKQQVDAAALDRVADCGERGDEEARERHRRLEDEPELRQVVTRPQDWIGEEQGEARPEQACEQDEAPEPVLVLGPRFLLSHLPLIGSSLPADRGQEWLPRS